MKAHTEFSHKDEWRLNGGHFVILVTRHTVNIHPEFDFDRLGPNRWAVYAYIYPASPYFDKFDNTGMFQDAAIDLPLHSGPSFLQMYYDKTGAVTSIQVGADYNHLYDEKFSYYANQDDASEVFADARRLFDVLGATVLGATK